MTIKNLVIKGLWYGTADHARRRNQKLQKLLVNEVLGLMRKHGPWASEVIERCDHLCWRVRLIAAHGQRLGPWAAGLDPIAIWGEAYARYKEQS